MTNPKPTIVAPFFAASDMSFPIRLIQRAFKKMVPGTRHGSELKRSPCKATLSSGETS